MRANALALGDGGWLDGADEEDREAARALREGAARIGWGCSCGGTDCCACERGYEGVCN